jgi:arylsulfatase A-like enzyme
MAPWLSRIACVLVVGLLAVPAQAAAKRPNFLVVIADDLGWRDVGYHGSEIRTPHLDRLAKAGVRLDRHYVYPTCSPTRAGLLTGRNPSRFGILAPIAGRSTDALPADTVTLARALKSRDYATALMGKWHLGLRPAVGPRRYGFDQTYGYFHGQIDPVTHLYKNGDRSWHRNDVLVDEKGHATDLIADEAVRFLEKKRETPFFLYVAFSVPHHPLQEEAKWSDPYRKTITDPSRRLYAASVTHMDAAIGRMVEALTKSGQLKDTLIFFTSDNGGQRDYSSKTEYGGKHGPYATLGDNRPLRGWKGELYEGGIRVPAFVSWSGKLRSATLEQTTSYLDIFPTFAALAGVTVEARWKLEGRNIHPLLAGEVKALPSPILYWRTTSHLGVREGDWKLIVSQRGRKNIELYDLAADPAEKKDLAREKPDKVKALEKRLAEQRKLDG